MHYNSCNEPLLLADKDAEGRVFQSSLSLGQIGKVIIYLSVFKWQCDVLGRWHSPVTAVVLSLHLSCHWDTASRTLQGEMKVPWILQTYSFPFAAHQNTPQAFRTQQ